MHHSTSQQATTLKGNLAIFNLSAISSISKYFLLFESVLQAVRQNTMRMFASKVFLLGVIFVVFLLFKLNVFWGINVLFPSSEQSNSKVSLWQCFLPTATMLLYCSSLFLYLFVYQIKPKIQRAIQIICLRSLSTERADPKVMRKDFRELSLYLKCPILMSYKDNVFLPCCYCKKSTVLIKLTNSLSIGKILFPIRGCVLKFENCNPYCSAWMTFHRYQEWQKWQMKWIQSARQQPSHRVSVKDSDEHLAANKKPG